MHAFPFHFNLLLNAVGGSRGYFYPPVSMMDWYEFPHQSLTPAGQVNSGFRDRPKALVCLEQLGFGTQNSDEKQLAILQAYLLDLFQKFTSHFKIW